MASDRPVSTTSPLHRRHAGGQSSAACGLTQSYLFEVLREMAFENCLEIAGHSLRIGLAVSQWQIEQARIFLAHFHQNFQFPQESHERVVALAMHAGLNPRSESRTNAVVILRKDGPQGLTLDGAHAKALEQLRDQGSILVEVEQIAFSSRVPLDSLLAPMIHALAGAVSEWGATDILAECPRRQAAFYCSRLGFLRLEKRKAKGQGERVLLHLPAEGIARLQG